MQPWHLERGGKAQLWQRKNLSVISVASYDGDRVRGSSLLPPTAGLPPPSLRYPLPKMPPEYLLPRPTAAQYVPSAAVIDEAERQQVELAVLSTAAAAGVAVVSAGAAAAAAVQRGGGTAAAAAEAGVQSVVGVQAASSKRPRRD